MTAKNISKGDLVAASLLAFSLGGALGVGVMAINHEIEQSNTYAVKLSDDEMKLRKAGLFCDEALVEMFKAAITVDLPAHYHLTVSTTGLGATVDIAKQCTAAKRSVQ